MVVVQLSSAFIELKNDTTSKNHGTTMIFLDHAIPGFDNALGNTHDYHGDYRHEKAMHSLIYPDGSSNENHHIYISRNILMLSRNKHSYFQCS